MNEDAESIPETRLKKWGKRMLHWLFFAFSAAVLRDLCGYRLCLNDGRKSF